MIEFTNRKNHKKLFLATWFLLSFVSPSRTAICLLTCVDKLSWCLKLNNSNFNFQICYIMNTNLTVKKILDKLARNQRLTHNEELFYMVEVLYFSEEKAEQMLASGKPKGRKVKMHSRKLATAA